MTDEPSMFGPIENFIIADRVGMSIDRIPELKDDYPKGTPGTPGLFAWWKHRPSEGTTENKDAG